MDMELKDRNDDEEESDNSFDFESFGFPKNAL